VSIIGSRITRGNRVWKVASVVRAGSGRRIILRAIDDPACKMVATAPSDAVLERTADLSAALALAETRSFRDPTGSVWNVEVGPQSRSGVPRGSWLVFVSETGAHRARIQLEGLHGIGSLEDGELVGLLARARQSPS
jgi:hypothetical protein